MALKEKFLILWILCAMLVAFLVSHAMAILVASLENACAFAFIPALLLKVAAALCIGVHS
jgi:hypothetical protein